MIIYWKYPVFILFGQEKINSSLLKMKKQPGIIKKIVFFIFDIFLYGTAIFSTIFYLLSHFTPTFSIDLAKTISPKLSDYFDFDTTFRVCTQCSIVALTLAIIYAGINPLGLCFAIPLFAAAIFLHYTVYKTCSKEETYFGYLLSFNPLELTNFPYPISYPQYKASILFFVGLLFLSKVTKRTTIAIMLKLMFLFIALAVESNPMNSHNMWLHSFVMET